MTTRSLPADATLESLKKQAKSFLKSLKSADPAALRRAEPYFAVPAAMGLQDAQLVLAREFGFSSWTKLKAHIERPSGAGEAPDRLANRFLSLAPVSYLSSIPADPARFAQAADLLQTHPDIADESLHVAAAIGDAERVRRWLSRDPRLLDRKGGPFDWTALTYAAYARLPGRSSLPAARVLLENGADPNAFWMDEGQYRFTVLTGVFGHGEAGKERQPAHPDCEAFARMLLNAGADPNDSQALYNRMFEPDDDCLRLLIEYGLSASDRNNWLVREDGRLVENGERVFDYQLAWALQNGMADRVRLLVGHGADPARPVNGRTPYEWALLGGNEELAAYLVSKGAQVRPLADTDRLVRACASLLREEAEAMVGVDPGLVARTEAAHPSLLHEAAGSGERERAALLLRLGFDVNRMTSRTPLHEAALHGDVEMARLLIAHGANTALRDPHHHAPPIGWALYNGRTEMAEFLKTQPMDIFAAAVLGLVLRIEELLDAEPRLLETSFDSVRERGRPDPDHDWLTPLGFAAIGGQMAAVEHLLGRGANARLRGPAGERLADIAADAGAGPSLVSLLKGAARRQAPSS
ncbi:MAG: ankyrin repeat domain-containing protein [Shinella sp.]|nr:ankyrin repeat domain-containing protein [Shinella sp.]